MKPNRKDMLKIISITATSLGLKPKDVLSSGRSGQTISDAKWIAVYAISQVTSATASDIARCLNLNISTVGFGIRSASNLILGQDKLSVEFTKKLNQVMLDISKPSNSRIVVIDVMCGVARLKSKPDDVDVIINQ